LEVIVSGATFCIDEIWLTPNIFQFRHGIGQMEGFEVEMGLESFVEEIFSKLFKREDLDERTIKTRTDLSAT